MVRHSRAARPMAAREVDNQSLRSYYCNRPPRVPRALASPAPGQDGVPQPPTLLGAAALNATNEEKLRELVMTLMGQERGDEPRGFRTPLLAPFITNDVLLRVNNILAPLDNAQRGGWGLQAALGRSVAALTGAPRSARIEEARHQGNAMHSALARYTKRLKETHDKNARQQRRCCDRQQRRRARRHAGCTHDQRSRRVHLRRLRLQLPPLPRHLA